MNPVKLQGGSIGAGYGPGSDSATGGNRSGLQAASSAGGRRARRRPPANRLLADVLRRRVDQVHVELFVLDLHGFHEGEINHRARADAARGR